MIIFTCPKCGEDLVDCCLTTFPPTHKVYCPECGWEQKETDADPVIRIPYIGQLEQGQYGDSFYPYGVDEYKFFEYKLKDKPDPCKNCPNNPANGGSGICHCILGIPTVYC